MMQTMGERNESALRASLAAFSLSNRFRRASSWESKKKKKFNGYETIHVPSTAMYSARSADKQQSICVQRLHKQQQTNVFHGNDNTLTNLSTAVQQQQQHVQRSQQHYKHLVGSSLASTGRFLLSILTHLPQQDCDPIKRVLWPTMTYNRLSTQQVS